MKKPISVIILVLVSLLVISCNFAFPSRDGELIEPSDVIVTQTRPVSGFTGIDMGTFGEVIITQGDTESLTIRGSDNIVPLVKTAVKNGVLVINMENDVNITGMNSDNVLTFTIAVKDLTNLAVSGASKVTMDTLATGDMSVDMSGAGNIKLGNLTADSLSVDISGVGNVEAAGEATTAKVDISGAGSFQGAELKVQTAEVNISGIGNIEIWVTDSLTGEISGGGSVKYYGSPTVSTTNSGVGKFESMGSK
jgi:hypothetical protein